MVVRASRWYAPSPGVSKAGAGRIGAPRAGADEALSSRAAQAAAIRERAGGAMSRSAHEAFRGEEEVRTTREARRLMLTILNHRAREGIALRRLELEPDAGVVLPAVVVDRPRPERVARELLDLLVGEVDGVEGDGDVLGHIVAELAVQRLQGLLVERRGPVDGDEEFRAVGVAQPRAHSVVLVVAG